MPATTRLVIGIDVGGTKALAGLVDEHLAVRATARRPTHDCTAESLLAVLVEEVEELRAQAHGEVVGVGLGIPALMSRDGRVLRAPNLRMVEGVVLADQLAAATGLPVVSDNDANCAVIAEHRFGAARGASDVVLLTVGTGVGGGLIVGGQPVRGAHGMAAELGHVVVEADGRPCIGDCPNRGCLEAEASGTALERVAHELAAAHPDTALGQAAAAGTLDGPRVTELAATGEVLAIEALRRIGTMLGVGMSSLANVFDPDCILVGGGVSAAGELLLGPARETYAARAMPPIVERCEVRLAHFGSEAGLLGAALLAFDAADAAAVSADAEPIAPGGEQGHVRRAG